MKGTFSIILLLVASCGAFGETSQKYERGDCITPTDESYSWYGKYALVNAFSRIDGVTSNKSYILSFPYDGSTDAIYDKEIEGYIKRVSPELCGR